MTDTLIQESTYDTFTQETTTDTLVQEITRTELWSEGIPGPPGPAGPAGPPGVGTAVPWQETVFFLVGNQTVFVLPATPVAGTVSLFTNGLRETTSNFTVAGATITVTGFVPTTGDTVTITYQ